MTIDVLPRFPDGQLRLRLMHIQAGREISVLMPQAIASAKRYPSHKRLEFSEGSFLDAEQLAPSQAFVDLIIKTVQMWLNDDVILWLQYGAKVKLNKIEEIFTLTLYPYPPI